MQLDAIFSVGDFSLTPNARQEIPVEQIGYACAAWEICQEHEMLYLGIVLAQMIAFGGNMMLLTQANIMQQPKLCSTG